jgi:hypothetical protein
MTIITNTPRPGETAEHIASRTRPRQHMSDQINSPDHYVSHNGMEVIDVIEGFQLTFHEGNIVKYLLRWRNKNGVEDLKKCRWYLDRFIYLVDRKDGS